MEQEMKEYQVPVVFGNMVNFTEAYMQQIITECAGGGRFRAISDVHLAGQVIEHDGTPLMTIGIPRRFTVRDWYARTRYNAVGSVKRGAGKGRIRYQCVGKGTEASMPANTTVKISGAGNYKHDVTLNYYRVNVANVFSASPGSTVLIKVDSLHDFEGNLLTMADIGSAYLTRAGLKTSKHELEPCALVPSEKHPGYYEGTVRAKPEALCLVGFAHVLVLVSPSRDDIGIAK